MGGGGGEGTGRFRRRSVGGEPSAVKGHTRHEGPSWYRGVRGRGGCLAKDSTQTKAMFTKRINFLQNTRKDRFRFSTFRPLGPQSIQKSKNKERKVM